MASHFGTLKRTHEIMLTDICVPSALTDLRCSFSFCFSNAILNGFWMYGPIVGIFLREGNYNT